MLFRAFPHLCSRMLAAASFVCLHWALWHQVSSLPWVFFEQEPGNCGRNGERYWGTDYMAPGQ